MHSALSVARTAVVTTLMLVMAACGPSAADQATERIAAAWEATDRLDANRAEAELRAANELSASTVDPIRTALTARITAVNLWNGAEADLQSGLHLVAIAGFTAAANTDSHFTSRSIERIRAAEHAYLTDAIQVITKELEAGDGEAAFEVLKAASEVFPTNTMLTPARLAVAEAYLPGLASTLDERIASDRPENAQVLLKEVLQVLGDDAPGATELTSAVDTAVAKAVEARRIAQRKEQERIAAELRAATEAAERERRAIFDRIGCNRDERERISRCYDRNTMTRTPTNRLYFWTFEADGQQPRLQMGLQTTSSRWIFFERARVYVDSQTYDINAGYFNVNRDNSGRSTWETFSRRATQQDLKMMYEIANANEVYVRFINSDRQYREHKLTAAQIRAVANMAAYWGEIG